MSPRITLAALVAAFLMTACNSSDFAGEAPQKSPARQGKPATLDNKPAHDEDGLGKPTPGKPNPGGADSDDGDDNKNDDDDVIDPGTTDDASNDTDQGGGKPDVSVFDILKGLLETAKDIVIDQPNDNEIIFGGAKVFHIGDGQLTQSSCKTGIAPYGLSGKRFYFEFVVAKNDTTITIDVKTICGVDYSDTNALYLSQGDQKVGIETLIAVGATNASLPQTTLQAGKYALVVESRTGSMDPGANPTDADDYIVGKIDVRADKPIKPGRVGAK